MGLGQKRNSHPRVSSLVKLSRLQQTTTLPGTAPSTLVDAPRRISRDVIRGGHGIMHPRKGESAAGTPWYATKTNPTDVADTSTPDRLASGDDVHHRLRMPRANAPDSVQDQGSQPKRGCLGYQGRKIMVT